MPTLFSIVCTCTNTKTLVSCTNGCGKFRERASNQVARLTTQGIAAATKRTLEPGEVLFREGEEGTQLYVVDHGGLRVLRRNAEVAVLGEKELVGEMAFFGDERRTATVIAAEETEVVEVDMSDARDYLSRQPVWMRIMLETLVRRVVERDESPAAVT